MGHDIAWQETVFKVNTWRSLNGLSTGPLSFTGINHYFRIKILTATGEIKDENIDIALNHYLQASHNCYMEPTEAIIVHDMWHIILKCSPSDMGEAALAERQFSIQRRLKVCCDNTLQSYKESLSQPHVMGTIRNYILAQGWHYVP